VCCMWDSLVCVWGSECVLCVVQFVSIWGCDIVLCLGQLVVGFVELLCAV